MKNLKRNLHLVGLSFMAVALSIGYTNCADFGAATVAASSEFSNLDGATVAECDLALMKIYQRDVHPFFKQSNACISCHIEGGTGLGMFSSDNAENSLASFKAASFSKVEKFATDATHKPPYTGPHHQGAMTAMGKVWLSAETEHLNCVSKAENGGVSVSVLTAPKSAPSIYPSNVTQTLSWELDLASDLDSSVVRTSPVVITVDVKVLYLNAVAKGYIFSNPKARLKTTGEAFVIEGLFFHLNGRPLSSQTTFTALSKIVSGTSFITLMSASANTLIEPISDKDKFQLYIRRVVSVSDSEDAPRPLTPILSAVGLSVGSDNKSYTRSMTVPVSILRDSGITRWCLSETAAPPADTEARCQNSLVDSEFVSNGWNLRRPTNFVIGSAGDGDKTVHLWVANDALKINSSPATISVTLDTVRPAAPNLLSLEGEQAGTADDPQMQVADLSASHPSEANRVEVYDWCVKERDFYVTTGPAVAAPDLNDACWTWTDNNAKPATVGLTGSGRRSVRLYVRDVAGNISLASNERETYNNFLQPTFTELTGNAANPRAIITRRCAACHESPTAPGYGQLNLFNYNVARQSNTLLIRINDPLSPMPNVSGGLMPQKERDMFRLWDRVGRPQ